MGDVQDSFRAIPHHIDAPEDVRELARFLVHRVGYRNSSRDELATGIANMCAYAIMADRARMETGRGEALEKAANDPAVLDRVASAIEAANCPRREGPYGLYDYSDYSDGAHKPHCVRDFRDPQSKEWGAFILCTNDRDEAAALYDRLTREYIAAAAIRALAARDNRHDGGGDGS